MNISESEGSLAEYWRDANSYSLEVGFSLNSVDSSPNGNFVVVAGREVFKVVNVEDFTSMREQANLRMNTKQSNLFHISDAKWNQLLQTKVVTATWTCQVVLWDLEKKGSKFQVAYDEHKRTVNKVCWSPQQANVLASGAQDGLIKIWDIRQPASTATFCHVAPGAQQGDAVRDVRFSVHQPDMFAAGMDSGLLKVWDLRGSTTTPAFCITAHNNNSPVRSLAWHPLQKELLASGSRDETVMVWDLNHLEDGSRFSIQTIAPISVIVWRPLAAGCSNTTEMVTAASTTHDLCIHMWNIFRPHIPVFTVKGHIREVTDVAWWKQSCDTLLSVSKDGTLRATVFKDPNIFKVPGTCLSWNVDGTLASVVDRVDRSCHFPSGGQPNLQEWLRGSRRQSIPRPLNVHCNLVMVQELAGVDVDHVVDPIKELAQLYRLRPKKSEDLSQICSHNAAVALLLHQDHLHEIWQLLALWCQPVSDGCSRVTSSDELKAERQGQEPAGEVANCSSSSGLSGKSPVVIPSLNLGSQLDLSLAVQSPRQPLPSARRGQPQLPIAEDPEDDAIPSYPVNVHDAVRELLEYCCEEGDVQTCCTILTILSHMGMEVRVDEDQAASWFLAYIDLLHQRQLFIIASDIIKQCPYPKVASISTRGTNVSAACGGCGSEVRANQSRCPRCAKRLYICVVCNQEVHGVVVWNSTCGHGGHAEHMREWFEKHRHCPKCGADAHL